MDPLSNQRDGFNYEEARRRAQRERALAWRSGWRWLWQQFRRTPRPHSGTKTDPSKAKTSSPRWFSPVLREKTIPQPGREASGRLDTYSVK
jgi:hypothetical protein